MPVRWTRELEARVLDLRENYKLSWDQIRAVLGFDTADVPRIRASRLRAKGTPPPAAGAYTYDFAALGTAKSYVPGPVGPGAPVDGKAEPEDEPLDYEVQARFIKSDYTFDGKEYYFPINGQIVGIPKDVWEQIVTEYSGQGGDLTQHEIAMRHGMHKKVLEACLRLYGHFKARPPVTREELKDAAEQGEMEPLYNRAIEVEEARFSRRLATERMKHLERQNHELKRQVANRAETLAFLKTCVADIAPVEPLLVAPAVPTDLVVFAPVYDLHIGMQVAPNSGAWDQPYSADIACEYLEEYAARVVQEVDLRSAGQGAKQIILGLGGDLFHAFLGRTEKGTPLERDRPDRVVFRMALASMTRVLETFRRAAADVVVLSIPGNHDHLFAELFEETLAAKFEGVPGVTIPNRLGSRDWFVIGDSLHVMDHGKGFERLNDKALLSADTLARAVAPDAYHDVRRVYLYVGHTHHHAVQQHGTHLEIVRVPTFCHTSNYEESLVLPSVVHGMSFALDSAGRIDAPKRYYVSPAQLVPRAAA